MSDSFVGRWRSAKEGSSAFLALHDDGGVNGSDGANAIATRWRPDGNQARLEPYLTTQRAARGMEAWVARALRVEADGDELSLLDAAGDRLGVLIRAEDEAQ